MSDIKVCATCGRLFRRRDNERPASFRIRKRCGFYCRPVTSPDKTGRARAAARFPARPCARCGMAYGGRGRVQRHHIDSDRMNNNASNIEFLCVKHHKDAHRLSDGQVGGGARPRIVALLRDRAIANAGRARELAALGLGHREIGDRMGVDRASVSRWFRKYPA